MLQTGASYPAASRTTSDCSSLLRAAVESRRWLASPAQGPTVPVRSRHLFFERVSSSVKIIMLFTGIQWQVVGVEEGGGANLLIVYLSRWFFATTVAEAATDLRQTFEPCNFCS